MGLHAELHRHLGGAVVPRILWRFFLRTGHPLAERFPQYEAFEKYYTREHSSLEQYLELHSLVESVQSLDMLPYFVSKLVRGAYTFETICYLELRHTPYLRTHPDYPETRRIAQMRDVVAIIAEAGRQSDYPIVFTQILCMHSRLPERVNRAIVELASDCPEWVCGVDLAGPDNLYQGRLEEFTGLFQRARSLGLRTTAHLYETAVGCHPELLPFLDRIGHGIQIPLRYPDLLPEIAARGQCLEICPTTYLKTGTFADFSPLREVFARCRQAGVDVVICTDNAGLHNVRLPFEFENLLTMDIMDFEQLHACQEAAFRHAFAWNRPAPPHRLLADILRRNQGHSPAQR